MLAPYAIETEDANGATDVLAWRTRAQAIADGEQFHLTADPDIAPIAADEHIDIPIYVTAKVWAMLEEVKDKPHLRRIRTWLILRPAKLSLDTQSGFPQYFVAIITRAPNDKYHPLLLVKGHRDLDDDTPVVTIAFQGEER